MFGTVPPIPQPLGTITGGSHVTNVPAFDTEDFFGWKDRRLANQDKRLKSIINACLLNDVMKSVIKCATTKSMWTNLILAHDGPSDTRDTKIAALRLEFNAFKALEGEKDNDSDVKEDTRSSRKYKGLKAEIAIFTKKIDVVSKSKSKKGLVAESFDWDDESVSSEDKGTTRFKAFMAIAKDEPSVEKVDARSDYTHVKLHYVEDQRKNLLSKFNSLNQELSSSDVITLTDLTQTSSVSKETNPLSKSSSVPDPCPDKKADSSTEQLLLTLMEENINSPDKSLEFTIDNDHPVHNEPDNFESHDNLKPAKVQDSIINEPISEAEPSPIIISPLAKVFINPFVPQDKWSREKHIDLVNIMGEPLAGVTTRSRIKDSKAASAHECLYMDEIGVVIKNKARLVAQGFIQEEMIGYDETFTPVARLEAIKNFIAYASYMGFMVYHMDVKSAFLNEKILEEVYVQQPPGFESSEFPNRVCKLDKALYGLIQVLRAWYETHLKFLIQHKFVRAEPRFTRLVAEVGMLNIKKEVPDKKKTVRAALATLGLADENEPQLSSTDLINSSPLRIRYFSATWRVLMLYIVKCLRGICLSSEHLLGDAYKNDNLKTMKPHKITASSFKPLTAFEVLLTSYMRKVAKLSEQLEKSLILPSRGVNADTTADKSSFGTAVQHGAQPKAATDKKSSKKKIPSSSKPKASNVVRKKSSPKKQAVETQHAEEPLVIADATKGVESSESAEEIRNQTKPAEAEKVHENIVEDNVEDPLATDSRIQSMEVDSDLESMLDDEIESVFAFEADSDDDEENHSIHKEELSKIDEAVAGNMTDVLVDMAHSKDTTDNASADKPAIIMADAFEERMHELLSDTLKNILPHIIKDYVKKALSKLDKRVKKTLKAQVSEIVLKPIYKEFNALIKMESTSEEPPTKKLKSVLEDFTIPSPTLLNTFRPLVIRPLVIIDKSLLSNIHQTFSAQDPLITLLFLPQRLLIKKRDKSQVSNDDQLKKLMPFMDEGESLPKFLNLHQFGTSGEGQMTSEEAKAQIEEIKRAKKLKGYNHCISFRDDPLPITKISYRVNNSTKEATKGIPRNNQPLNYKIYDKHVLKKLGLSKWLEVFDVASKSQSKSNDQLLKNLKAKFQWVATQVGKLGIPSPYQLTAFELPSAEKKKSLKRKRRAEVIKELFVKENIVVHGMHGSLVPYVRVVGSPGLVVAEPEAEIRLSVEDSLSAKHQQAKKDSLGAKYQREMKGLAECKASVSNLRRIQVKDIVKEVKDYLKTYSSTVMDISWHLLLCRTYTLVS
uniref:Retrovirus-related Pol polyprotein from transposon TNT 1-94 n=1 Tax=Tanacetum cinerariifolium TaxID=118510 RepID=A0A6L2K0E7_TANCI|nr:retrovirus-related Pol polyprotein from transposon TNT 1-94 [Tanacetum cinerariifolium]